jgi:hypothetical protein
MSSSEIPLKLFENRDGYPTQHSWCPIARCHGDRHGFDHTQCMSHGRALPCDVSSRCWR